MQANAGTPPNWHSFQYTVHNRDERRDQAACFHMQDARGEPKRFTYITNSHLLLHPQFCCVSFHGHAETGAGVSLQALSV